MGTMYSLSIYCNYKDRPFNVDGEPHYEPCLFIYFPSIQDIQSGTTNRPQPYASFKCEHLNISIGITKIIHLIDVKLK